MILVDSTVLIDILRGQNGVLDVLQKNAHQDFGISAISVEEIYAGLGYSQKKLNARTFQLILQKHEELLLQYHVIPITNEILIQAGYFRGANLAEGVTIDSPDAIIAATATMYKAKKIITRNPDHFQNAPIPIESYSL